MILNKPYTQNQYRSFAAMCNKGRLAIIDKGAYLQAYEQPSPKLTNEDIRAKREAAYVAISDKLKSDYDEAVARGADNAEELKIAWLESKDKIREENPYIVEESEVI